MSFRSKNAGATCQQLVNMMFEDQIGRNVKVYVNNMLAKSAKSEDHIEKL